MSQLKKDFRQRNEETLNRIDKDLQKSEITKPADQLLHMNELVRQYGRSVLSVCLAYTKHLQDAEDISQDVLITALQKLHTLENPQRVHTWLLQIARHRCIDFYRKHKPILLHQPDMIEAKQHPHSEPAEHLHLAIKRIPDKYREPICLFYFDRMKCYEIAQVMKLSEDAVRRRLVRGRALLHDILSEEMSDDR